LGDVQSAELVGDRLQLIAREEHQRRRPVPQVVQPNWRQTAFLDQAAEGAGQAVRR
jgi:hypothetical protein